MANQRDDFHRDVVDALAKRACYHCSNPNCRVPTLMPSAIDPLKFIYSGVASHITAAAEGGPRYDAKLTKEERADIANGIHLCASCSIKIDKNKGLDYPAPVLQEWKKKHEEWIGKLSQGTVEGLEAAFQDGFAREVGRDIVTLVRQTRRNLAILSQFACIQTSTASIRIERSSAIALKQALDEDHLAIVGEPGAGKSGATYDAAELLMEEGADIIALNAGNHAALSLGMLQSELNLSLPLEDILAHWQSDKPGFLIIDGLDGARTQGATETLRDLIGRVIAQRGRWHVLTSVRKFDLRYSPHLQRLFPGTPVTNFSDHEFASVRHINIPLLSDDELNQVATQSSELASLLASASAPFLDLLRVPFNLRLAADLLGGREATESLNLIRTQVGLLERYWQERIVREDGNGDGREVVIGRMLEKMLERGTLLVDRRTALGNEASAGATLQGVLSSHLLVEWKHQSSGTPDKSVLAFAHHILFDYAVARLILRGIPDSLIDRVKAEPHLVLSIRPSFVLHFQYLWEHSADRAEFWDWTIAITGAENIPMVGKLIGPSVAAELATLPDDFKSLIALADARSTAAEQTIYLLLGAAQSLDHPLSGSNATPWCEFVERCTCSPNLRMVSTACILMMKLSEHVDDLNNEQTTRLGLAARRILEVAWGMSPPHVGLANNAIVAVCRTFSSNPPASEELLRKILAPSQLAERGYEEMPRVASEIQRLFRSNVALTADIYCTAYRHKENSQAKTLLSNGVVGLYSTRSQNYDLALYQLSEAYKTLLPENPQWGTELLMQIIADEVVDIEAKLHLSLHSAQFRIGEIDATLIYTGVDENHRWSFVPYKDHFQLLQYFTVYLSEIGSDPERSEARKQVLDIVLRSNRSEVLWRCLIEVATATPDTFGQELKSLLWASPILASVGMHEAVTNFLRVMFPQLSLDERAATEEAILAIPASMPKTSKALATQYRNRLLSKIERTYATLPKTLSAMDEREHELAQMQGQLQTYLSVPTDHDEENLTSPSPNDPVMQRITAHTPALQELAEKYGRGVPSPAEAEDAMIVIKEIFSLLVNVPFPSETTQNIDYAWGFLASACVAVARLLPTFSCDTDALREVLLMASTYPAPRPDILLDAQFARSGSWYWPCTRESAAHGLVLLASRGADNDENAVVQAIKRLSEDAVPAVRYVVVRHLDSLYDVVPELAKRISENLAQSEANWRVASMLVGSLDNIAQKQVIWTRELIGTIYERFSGNIGAISVRQACASIFVNLYLNEGDIDACLIVNRWVQDVVSFHSEVMEGTRHVRPLLTIGPISPPNPADDAKRQRSIALLGRLLHAAIDVLGKITKEYEGVAFSEWSDEIMDTAKNIHEITQRIGDEVYFASGAFSAAQNQGIPDTTPPDASKQRRYLTELSPLIEELTESISPHLAYEMLKMFEVYIECDPKMVFLLMDRIVSAAKAVEFEFDGLAAELAVQLTSRFMAEYSHLLRADAECRQALLRILDTFVLAGWPKAIRLAYRLGDIYR